MALVKIHDCIIFADETELLYLRLRELYPIIDDFLIVHATTTFQGAPRNVVRVEEDSRFAPFMPKVRQLLVDDLPTRTSPWFAEYAQRNAMTRVLGSLPPDDLVLLSDVDEIPSRAAVDRARELPVGRVGTFDMRFFYYGLNWELPERWRASRVFHAAALEYLSPQELRSCPADVVFHEPSWHFSYFYERRLLVGQIRAKAGAFSHAEFAAPPYLDEGYLAFCTRAGLSWCTSPKYAIKLQFRSVDGTYPEDIKADMGRWQGYVLDAEERDHVAEARGWLLYLAANGRVASTRLTRKLAKARPLSYGVTR
jgi:beta-1,4-mannosyl-glycoprotein beta-1,4-N-acetylglucosaminyltransferase